MCIAKTSNSCSKVSVNLCVIHIVNGTELIWLFVLIKHVCTASLITGANSNISLTIWRLNYDICWKSIAFESQLTVPTSRNSSINLVINLNDIIQMRKTSLIECANTHGSKNYINLPSSATNHDYHENAQISPVFFYIFDVIEILNSANDLFTLYLWILPELSSIHSECSRWKCKTNT